MARMREIAFAAALGGALMLAGACEDDDMRPPVSRPSPAQTSGTPAVGTPSPIEGFEQGRRYWGVYVFVGDFDDPGYEAAIERLETMGLQRGLNFSDGQLGCDQGAADDLGLSEREAAQAAAVGVYFHDEADARSFAASLDPPPEGIARIRALCAD